MGRTSMAHRVLPVLCCAVLTCAAGCASAAGSAADDTSPPAPRPGHATAVAQREYGSLSGAGWGAAWDLWTPAAQRAITRAGYVHVNTVCPPHLGVPYIITGTRSVNATTVRVRYRHGHRTGTNTVRYIAGRWRFAPGPTLLRRLRRGPAKLIAKRRAAGRCGHR